MEGVDLIRPFSLKEVKIEVCDCDSFKCDGSDDVHFGFIKDFWIDLKHDLERFVLDFH